MQCLSFNTTMTSTFFVYEYQDYMRNDSVLKSSTNQKILTTDVFFQNLHSENYYEMAENPVSIMHERKFFNCVFLQYF